MRTEIEKAVELLQQRDEAGVEQALTLLQNTVFSFSMRVCGQREDAEDTMQEVLLRSIPQLAKFDSPKALVVWLYKVAKNRCLMSRRKSKIAAKQELALEQLMPDRAERAQLAVSGGINPESFAIRSQEAQWLRDAIQRVPLEYRIILVLRDMEDLAEDEVAEITGLRAGTVRVRLHRARLFVRKQIAKRMRSNVHSNSQTPSVDRRPMKCKALFAQLSSYLDEQLDDSMCAELEKHMDGCEPCKAFISTLEGTIKALQTAPGEKLHSGRAGAIRHQLAAKYRDALLAIVRSR